MTPNPHFKHLQICRLKTVAIRDQGPEAPSGKHCEHVWTRCDEQHWPHPGPLSTSDVNRRCPGVLTPQHLPRKHQCLAEARGHPRFVRVYDPRSSAHNTRSSQARYRSCQRYTVDGFCWVVGVTGRIGSMLRALASGLFRRDSASVAGFAGLFCTSLRAALDRGVAPSVAGCGAGLMLLVAPASNRCAVAPSFSSYHAQQPSCTTISCVITGCSSRCSFLPGLLRPRSGKQLQRGGCRSSHVQTFFLGCEAGGENE